MFKKCFKSLLSGSLFALGLLAFMPHSLAEDFAKYDFSFKKQADVWVAPMLLEKNEFNSIGLKVEGGTIEGLMADFGRGWEPVILHDDYGKGQEGLEFTSPTNHVQFKADRISGDQVKLKSTVFYFFGDGIGGPEVDEAAIVNQGYKTYSRAEWGADERLRVRNTPSLPGTNSGSNESDNVCADTDGKYAQEYKIVSTEKYNENGQELLWPVQKTDAIEKFAVHHTDSQIKDVTGDGFIDVNDYKAIVRAIYSYHTKTRGWGDMGYNYLIDPLGNIYEGRYGGDFAIGAHSLCFNPETLGIAMIGNYDEEPITKPAFEALTQLISQKAKQYNIDPLASAEYRGKYLDNIFGHRDVKSTSCPGAMLYAQLESIRTSASLAMKNMKVSGTTQLDYNAELVSGPEPVTLDLNQSKTVTVQFKNTGKETWDNTTWLHVAANNNAAGRIIPVVEGKNFVAAGLKEASVAPGETGTFDVTVQAGAKGGNYTFQVSPVINGKYKISRAQTGISISSASPVLLAKTKRLKTVNALAPGEKAYFELEVQNVGNITWTPETVKTTLLGRGVSVNQRFLSSETVAPEGITKLGFWVQAPSTEGYASVYLRSRYKMGNEWTEIRGAVSNLVVRITKDAASSSTNSLSASVLDAKTPLLPGTSPQSAEKPFRVKLSHESDTATLTADSAFQVMNESNQVLFDLEKGSQVTASKSSVNEFTVKNGGQVKYAGLVRIVPKDKNGVTEIMTMERRPTWNTSLNDNRFRDVVEMRLIDGKVNYINELPLEHYIKGLAEVSNSDPTEKQKVIAVLARTYAQFYMDPANRKFEGMPYDGSDDPNVFQRYLGYGVEIRSPNFVAAATDTQGMVVKYNGQLVKTPYFNQSDGRTRSAQEVWGWTNTPYLQSVSDPWCDGLSLKGHGVGLSGYGATKQAEAGKTFDQIIKYYYSGVTVEKL